MTSSFALATVWMSAGLGSKVWTSPLSGHEAGDVDEVAADVADDVGEDGGRGHHVDPAVAGRGGRRCRARGAGNQDDDEETGEPSPTGREESAGSATGWPDASVDIESHSGGSSGDRGAHRTYLGGEWSAPAVGRAGRAQAEQLEPVGVDAIPGPPTDLADHRLEAGVADIGGPPTARAHDVVVVGRLAGDVGVLARRQVEALHGAEFLEQVERAEDRRPADPEPSAPGVGDEVCRGERPRTRRDEFRDDPPRSGHPVPRVVEGRHERLGGCHTSG